MPTLQRSSLDRAKAPSISDERRDESKEQANLGAKPSRPLSQLDNLGHDLAHFHIDSSTGKRIEVINLLDDSDDEETTASTPNASNGPTQQGAPKSTGLRAPSGSGRDSTTVLEDDEEIVIVTENVASSTLSTASEPLSESNSGSGKNVLEKDDDEEVAIVATKGQNALVDFPHARANCVSHPFSLADKVSHCPNCFCYVCDVPADDCKEWDRHCSATHDDRRWRAERERAKRMAREALAQPSRPAAAAAPSASSAMSSTSRSSASMASAHSAEFSVRKLLETVTTVHPVEMQPPAGRGFTTSLRHYQKQSLAFMVNTERHSNRGGWLADEVGMGKTAVVLALVATNRAEPRSVSTEQQLLDTASALEYNGPIRQNILQSYRAERSRLHNLSCEVEGMDRLEQQMHHKLIALEMGKISALMKRRLSSELKSVSKVKVKTTVIFTSVSLLGQWEDEIAKHAPGLVVKTFHHSRKKASQFPLNECGSIRQLFGVDIILSASTQPWPENVTKNVEFYRVVQDESHLFKKASASVDKANKIVASRRWGVSTTPMTNSFSDLGVQLSFLQGTKHTQNHGDFGSLQSGLKAIQTRPSRDTFDAFADVLGTFMVRHTKSQRIHGSEALALPPSTTSTVLLTMTREEDSAFNHINTSAYTFARNRNEGANSFVVTRMFSYQMTSVRRSSEHSAMTEVFLNRRGYTCTRYNPERLTKIVALRQDLYEQKRLEPRVRAVVFTQYLDVHEACVRGLQQDGFDVFGFTGTSSAQQRDKAIRNFQNLQSSKSAVFVITLGSGNTGITLTAASRVYLLEPCIDPAAEVQAAGRIHRLGQDKPCHVTKFAFRDSYESNVIRLHEEISAGRISVVDGFVPPQAVEILAQGLRLKS